MKIKSNFKIFMVMKSTSKTKISHYFWALLLMISLKDLILIFYNWAPTTTIEGTMNFKF